MLFVLIKNRLLLLTAFLRKKNAPNYRSRVLRSLLLLFIPWWVYQSTVELFSSWTMLPGFKIDIIYNYTLLSITGLFFLMIFSGIPLALHYHFLAKDLPLLFSLPVKKTTLFQYKLFEQTLANSTAFALIGLPILLALFYVLNYNLVYLIPILILIAVFLVIPSGISSLLSALIAFILPVKKSRQVSSIVLGFIIIGIWTLIQFYNFDRIDPFSGEFDRDIFEHFLGNNSIRQMSWMPSVWLVLSLKALLLGSITHFILFAGLLTMTCILLGYISSWLLQYAHENEKFIFSETAMFPHQSVKRTRDISHSKSHKVFTALIERDWKLNIRDSRFVTQLFFFVALVIVFSTALNTTLPITNETISHYQPFTLLILAATIMAGGLASRSIAIEKKAFYNNLICPLPFSFLLQSKKVLPAILTFLAVSIGLLTISIISRPSLIIIAQITVFLLFHIAAITGIGLLIGVKYSQLKWDNPRAMLGETGGVLLNVSILLYTGILVLTGVVLTAINTWFALIIMIILSIVTFLATSTIAKKQIVKIKECF